MPTTGATTCCRSIISSYNCAMVSSNGPNSSYMDDFHFAMLKLWEDNHLFSTMRCSTCCFTTTNSFLSHTFSFSRYYELSYAEIAKETLVSMITRGSLLILVVITFSMETEIRLWESFGKNICLCCTILFLSWSNMTLHTSMNLSSCGDVIPISPNGR